MEGTLIKDVDGFREYVVEHYTSKWENAAMSEIYKQFGKPKRYPFVFVFLPCIDPSPGPFGDSPILTKIYF